MEKQRHSITINAPREKVWKTMLDDVTYRQWTTVFSPGSYYEGSWEKGSEIRFLGPHPETGQLGGMYARISDNRPDEFVSVEHLGIIEDGVVDTTSEAVKKWAPAYETYTFNDKDGATELVVETDTEEEFAEMFRELWPKALQQLKALAER